MFVRNVVKHNFYRDSMPLFRISENAKKLRGVVDAAVVMGTSTNKKLLENIGLLDFNGKSATEADLIVAVAIGDEEYGNSVFASIEKLLVSAELAKGGHVYSVDTALKVLPDANFAIVSVAGEYAAGITRLLLERGLHVHLFSDHVSLRDEVDLKHLAAQRGLLLLGPGAGTSLIAGKGIGFANLVRRGNVGIVAAAGTGLQEVSVLLDHVGLGVSQGLGVGAGDVKSGVGGLMTLKGIAALDADPETSVILVVSKPPDIDVYNKIMDYVEEKTRKTVVVSFLGAGGSWVPKGKASRVKIAKTLHAATLASAGSVAPNMLPEAREKLSFRPDEYLSIAKTVELQPNQRFVRGLYSGGTLAFEALVLLGEFCGDVWSNTPLETRLKLPESEKSLAHSIIDFGEEEFTHGRLHPMIDPTIRKHRLVEEAKDPEVAVIMLDFVLGYGSNPDPAGVMIESIVRAKQVAEKSGRNLPIFAHVCGTKADPQNLSSQVEKLEQAGVRIFPTNASMAVCAGTVAIRDSISLNKLSEIMGQYLDWQG